MFKRPLLWLLVAYISGSLVSGISFYLSIVVAIVLLLIVTAYWFLRSKNRQDYFLFAMPALYLVGYLLMWNQQLPGPLDEALAVGPIHTVCEGRVCDLVQTDTSVQILLSDVSYSDSLRRNNVNQHYHSNSRIYVYISKMPQVEIGNVIRVAGKLAMFTLPTNLGQFDERQYYKLQNIDYRMMATDIEVKEAKVDEMAQYFYELRNRLEAVYACFDTKTASVLNAMLVGDTKNMEPEVKEMYQVAGISHVISISGMHITLVGMAVFAIVLRFFGRKWATLLAIVFILFYGVLTGFRVATNRAVVMMIVLLGAGVIGRTYDLLSATSLSAFIILLQEPMQLYNSGFLLSYGAILGIGVSYPCMISLLPLEEWKRSVEVKNLELTKQWQITISRTRLMFKCKLAQLLVFQCAIQVILLPLTLWSYYRIPTYSFFMNLLVVPIMSYVVLFGLPAGLIGCLSLPIGRFFLASTHYIIQYSTILCGLVYKLPGYYYVAGKPSLIKLILYSAVTVVGLWLAMKKRRIAIPTLIVGVVLLLYPFPKGDRLTITALDVGQGDCLVVETPNGGVYMVDGGSSDVGEVGKYRILPFLYAKGIDTIDYLFVTHGDADHVSGVLEVLIASEKGECVVRHLVLPDTSYEDDNYRALVEEAKKCGVPLVKLKRGDSIVEGELSISCLHPTPTYAAASTNDYSLVLSLDFREFDMLFTGDVEKEGEDEFYDFIKNKEYEVLKVAHHGSKNSTKSKLLQRIHPRIGLISCGARNTYGHPHKEVLERLDEIGCKRYITKDCGAIEVTTDGEKVWVDGYR